MLMDPGETDFHEVNDIFELTATLHGNKLHITLTDFINRTIYSKQYTEEDAGKQIHKKMDLIDIKTAFSQTKLDSGIVSKLKNYQLGTIIEHEGNPCYKIQKGGKLTVYLSMLDKKIKKEVIYQSNLLLNKIRDLGEREILAKEGNIDKSAILSQGQLKEKIQRQEKQREELLARIFGLEEEVRALKQGQKDINERFQQKITLIAQKNQRLQQKVAQLIQQLELQTKHSLNKFTQIQSKLKPINKPHTDNIHNLQYLSKRYFLTDGLKVHYTSPNASNQYIFNSPINPTQQLKFKIKILKTQKRCIMIGIVDYAKQKDKRDSYNSGNAMGYCGDSRIYPESNQIGSGYEQGDIVQVDVRRASSMVKYFVNGVLETTQYNAMLADGSRIFMPYIEVYHSNDAVEWLVD